MGQGSVLPYPVLLVMACDITISLIACLIIIIRSTISVVAYQVVSRRCLNTRACGVSPWTRARLGSARSRGHTKRRHRHLSLLTTLSSEPRYPIICIRFHRVQWRLPSQDLCLRLASRSARRARLPWRLPARATVSGTLQILFDLSRSVVVGRMKITMLIRGSAR